MGGILSGIGLLVICIYFTRRRLLLARRVCYPMSSVPRGICLIINNKVFHNSSNLLSRRGSTVDAKRLSFVFRNTLHFEVIVKSDLTAIEILNACEEIARNTRVRVC